MLGLDGVVVGIDRFGMSAPGDTVLEELGYVRGQCGQAGSSCRLGCVSEPIDLNFLKSVFFQQSLSHSGQALLFDKA